MPSRPIDARLERSAILRDALQREGLSLRRDSALCEAFLDGSAHPDLTAERVADVCALHRFLYEYTSYADDCARTLPRMAASLAGPMGSISAAWKFVRDTEAPVLKIGAVAAAGGVPEVWPWLLEDARSPARETTTSPICTGGV